MKFIATIINALAVQRQAEGVSHSANTLTSGYKQPKGFLDKSSCDSPQNVGYKQRGSSVGPCSLRCDYPKNVGYKQHGSKVLKKCRCCDYPQNVGYK